MSRIAFLFEMLSFECVVSKNVAWVSDISAVNLMVKWNRFASFIKSSTSFVVASHTEAILSIKRFQSKVVLVNWYANSHSPPLPPAPTPQLHRHTPTPISDKHISNKHTHTNGPIALPQPHTHIHTHTHTHYKRTNDTSITTHTTHTHDTYTHTHTHTHTHTTSHYIIPLAHTNTSIWQTHTHTHTHANKQINKNIDGPIAQLQLHVHTPSVSAHSLKKHDILWITDCRVLSM